MDVNKIFKNSRKKKDAESTFRVPRLGVPYRYKGYLCTLVQTANKTNDFESMVRHVLSLPELKPYFQEIYFGNLEDPYRLLNFMLTSLSSLIFAIKKLIQEEHRIRTNYADTKQAYLELTSVYPNAEQKAVLMEFEQVIRDTIIGNTRTETEGIILSGHKSETNILASEKSVHEPRKQKLQDDKEMAEIRIPTYPVLDENIIKNSYHQKISENPELAKPLKREMNQNLSPIKTRGNGNGLLKKRSKNGKPKPEPSPLSRVSINANKDEIE